MMKSKEIRGLIKDESAEQTDLLSREFQLDKRAGRETISAELIF
jgi:hypothetical protein